MVPQCYPLRIWLYYLNFSKRDSVEVIKLRSFEMGGYPGLSKCTINTRSALILKGEAEVWIREGDLRTEAEVRRILSLKVGKGKEIDSP